MLYISFSHLSIAQWNARTFQQNQNIWMCADSVMHKHNIRFEECMQSQEINSMNSYAVHGIIFSVYFVMFFFLFFRRNRIKIQHTQLLAFFTIICCWDWESWNSIHFKYIHWSFSLKIIFKDLKLCFSSLFTNQIETFQCYMFSIADVILE